MLVSESNLSENTPEWSGLLTFQKVSWENMPQISLAGCVPTSLPNVWCYHSPCYLLVTAYANGICNVSMHSKTQNQTHKNVQQCVTVIHMCILKEEKIPLSWLRNPGESYCRMATLRELLTTLQEVTGRRRTTRERQRRRRPGTENRRLCSRETRKELSSPEP